MSLIAQESLTTQRQMSWMVASMANDMKTLARNLSVGQRSVQDEFKKTASMGNELSGMLRNLIGVAAAGIGFRAILNETIQSQDAFVKLEAVLASVGSRLKMTADQWYDYGTEIQNTTRYSRNAVMEAASMMATMEKIGEDIMPAAIKSAANLAGLMGGDLTSASRMLGRALNDPTNGLSMMRRAGVQFTETQQLLIKGLFEAGKEAEAQQLILATLEDRVGKVSGKMRQTLGGALAHLKNSFGDLIDASEGSGADLMTEGINELAETLKDPAVKEGFQLFVSGFAQIAGAAARIATFPFKAMKDMADHVAMTLSGNALGNVETSAQATEKIKALSERRARGYDIDVSTGSKVELSKEQMAVLDGYIAQLIDYRKVLRDAEAGNKNVSESEAKKAEATAKAAKAAADAKAILQTSGESLAAWNARLQESIGFEAALSTVLQTVSEKWNVRPDLLKKAYAAARPVAMAEADMAETLKATAVEVKAGLVSWEEYGRLKAKLKLQVDELRYAETHAFEQFMATVDPTAKALENIRAQIAQLRATTQDPIKIQLAISAIAKQQVGGLVGSETLDQKRSDDLAVINQMDAGPERDALNARSASIHQEGLRSILEADGTAADMLREKIMQLTDSVGALGDAFGGVGQRYAKAVNGILGGFDRMIEGNENLRKAKQEVNILDERSVSKTAPEYLRATERLKRAQDAQVHSQIRGYGDMAESAKGFFSEGSHGYKAMEAASRAFHTVDLALTLAKQGPKMVDALLSALAAPFPANFAAFAAVGAILASLGLGSSSGGGGLNIPTGDPNKGTGTVLGDPDAQSESIVKSIDALTEIESAGLEISRMMLVQLRSIDRALRDVGIALVQNFAISGSALPTGFSTGSESILLGGKWGEMEKGMADLMTLGVGHMNIPIVSEIANAVTDFIGNVTNQIARGIYHSKTTQTAGGIDFDPTQTLGDIAEGGVDAQFFASFKKVKRVLGVKTSTKRWTEYIAMAEETQNEFTNIITSLGDVVLTSIDLLGGDVEKATEILMAMELGIDKIDLKGLTGEEIQERLSAVFSALGDRMATEVAKMLDPDFLTKYQQIGEGAMETLLRVASQTAALTDALKVLGIQLDDLEIMVRVEITQAMIDMAGGLEGLASGINSFFQNFFTQQEQLAAEATRLNSAFVELNYESFPATRDQFREMVQALDLTTEEGQDAFVVLTGMAERMSTFYDFWEQQEENRLELLHSEAATLNDLVDAYRNAGTALEKYMATLLTSNMSPLTPGERLMEAQHQFGEAFTAAMGGDLASAGQLQGLANTVLSLARDVFASSPDYTQIFADIMDALGLVSGTYETVTPEQLIVENLFDANTELNAIRETLVSSGFTQDQILAAMTTVASEAAQITQSLAEFLAANGITTSPTTPVVTPPPVLPPVIPEPTAPPTFPGGQDELPIYTGGVYVIPRASGGPVWGAGGPFSDQVPVMGSNGEFMMNSGAVDKYGLGFMHSVNNGTFGVSGLQSTANIDMSELLYEVQQLRRSVEDADTPINLKVVTPDGRVLVDTVMSNLKERSRRGEAVVYVQGVVDKKK